MAKKIKGEIVDEPKPQVLTGLKHVASIKPGWRVNLQPDGRAFMAHPDHQPRIVDLSTVAEGDELPRDTDEVLGFAPPVTGQ